MGGRIARVRDQRNLQAADRIRHDLGRYATLQQRFLPDPASDDDLREALTADLSATHRGPDGVRSAAEVWERLAPERAAFVGDPALMRIGALVAEIAAALPRLPRASRAELDALASSARALAEACRALGRGPG